MVDTTQATIRTVIAHLVGNKENGEGLSLADSELDISGEKLKETLRTYFLTNIQTPVFYSFASADVDVTSNPMYTWVSEIFNNPARLVDCSRQMAQHLFLVTQHPNVKSGELYVVLLSDLVHEGRRMDAIGLYKAETKEKYLKLQQSSKGAKLLTDEGTNVRKLDKGCLILNTESEAGYKLMIVDQANASEAHFWKENFLNVKPWSDAYHHTQNFLSLTRDYLSDRMQDEFKVSKADQIDLMNRSVDFFKSHDHFDQREFESEVLADPNVIESFRKFGNEYRGQSEADIIDNFEISAHAVKRQARIFKSVLKLDKNFHIYIHGNRELIERGYDEVMDKKYYKIFFDSESQEAG
jgi:hypothetical protein